MCVQFYMLQANHFISSFIVHVFIYIYIWGQLSLWTLQSCWSLCARKFSSKWNSSIHNYTKLCCVWNISFEQYCIQMDRFKEQWSIGKCFYFNELLLWSIYAFVLQFSHIIDKIWSQKFQTIYLLLKNILLFLETVYRVFFDSSS